MIPKKLHLICRNKCNAKYYVNRFAQIYTDYEILLYDIDDICVIINEYFPHHLNVKNKPLLFQIFRYLILYLEGGIYADIDCIPLKKIDGLFKDTYCHGDYRGGNKDGACTNCILVKGGDIKTYKCMGHLYINEHIKTIVSYEQYPNQISNSFIITQPHQSILLDCYRQSIIKTRDDFSNVIFSNVSNICILPQTFFGGCKTIHSYIEK